MTKFIYIFFSKDSLIVTDGETSLKNFKIHNFQDYEKSLTYVDMLNPNTKLIENILIPKNLLESSYKNIPCVPVFQSIINNFEYNIIKFRNFLKEEFSVSKLFKSHAIVSLPDDLIELDRRCIDDFLISIGYVKQIYTAQIGLTVSNSIRDYCTLTKSSRAITLSLIMYGGFIDQIFFPIDYTNLEHIKIQINLWLKQFNLLKLPVFLYGDNMELFSQLGTMLINENLLENMKALSETIKKGQVKIKS